MKVNKFSWFCGFLLISTVAFSQGYVEEGLMYSQSSPIYGSTARIQGIGGAQVSLGADMSSAASNPAGLGFFNKNVFSFTPNMSFHKSNTSYLGSQFSSFNNNFNIGNFGIVLNSNKGDYTEEKFKSGSFVITYNRINDFNSDFYYRGRNNASVIDELLNQAGDLTPEELESSLDHELAYAGYENFLIESSYDENDNFTGYYSFIEGLPLQTESVSRRGGQSQLNFAWGGNYDDRFYFGGGVGITTVRYSINRRYREEQFRFEDEEGNEQMDDLIRYTVYDDDLTVNGGGINATLGIIVRPVNFITVGASYITPTYYSLEDENGFVQRTYWNGLTLANGDVINETTYRSVIYVNQYNLRTPGKINLGATAFLGKHGFISGDVQFVDYQSIQLKSGDFSTTEMNQEILDLYKNVINFNIGSEFRLDNFRFRAGFAHFGDPYDDGDFFDESRRNLTFGVGYRTRDYFIDLALVNSKTKDLFETYYPAIQGEFADVLKETNTVSATVGFNF